MNPDRLQFREKIAWRNVSRLGFLQNAASAGAGLMIGSEIVPRASAQEAAHAACPVMPRPIPHFTNPPGTHFFFPGPVDADPTTSPNACHGPSIITDISGVIAEADLFLSGKGTDLNSGQTATYDFHTDMRFMSGIFVGLDNQRHRPSRPS